MEVVHVCVKLVVHKCVYLHPIKLSARQITTKSCLKMYVLYAKQNYNFAHKHFWPANGRELNICPNVLNPSAAFVSIVKAIINLDRTTNERSLARKINCKQGASISNLNFNVYWTVLWCNAGKVRMNFRSVGGRLSLAPTERMRTTLKHFISLFQSPNTFWL